MGTASPLSSLSLPRLLNSYLVFKLASYKSIVEISSRLLRNIDKTPLEGPLNWVIRNTFYRQFAGGENFDQLEKTVKTLHSQGISSILDYAAESDARQQISQNTLMELTQKLQWATNLSEKYPGSRLALKMTAFYPYELLLHMSEYFLTTADFYELEAEALRERFPEFSLYSENLCQFLRKSQPFKVMIDAERLEIQPAIDFICLKLMQKFNTDECFVANTYQMYLEGSRERLLAHLEFAKNQNINFGIKLVRGAYLKSDHGVKLSALYGPIYSSLSRTDENYNNMVTGLFSKMKEISCPRIDLILATHNRKSLEKLIDSMACSADSVKRHQLSTAQLLGMQDKLTLDIKHLGMNTFKYVPYGPVNLTIPYLIRRAQENSDILRNSSELADIKQEILARFWKKGTNLQ